MLPQLSPAAALFLLTAASAGSGSSGAAADTLAENLARSCGSGGESQHPDIMSLPALLPGCCCEDFKIEFQIEFKCKIVILILSLILKVNFQSLP